MPLLVDQMDNRASEAYAVHNAALLYILDESSKIAYIGAPSLANTEGRQALQKLLARKRN
jgi:cytochrome oxidase Cu insertion factor (SCO1/SenC/PrrC family)